MKMQFKMVEQTILSDNLQHVKKELVSDTQGELVSDTQGFSKSNKINFPGTVKESISRSAQECCCMKLYNSRRSTY